MSSSFLSFHCGVRAGIVDSNVVRLYSRLYGMKSTPESHRSRLFKEVADVITPRREFKAFNYAVLDFTRNVCTPTPHCDVCPLLRACSHGRTLVREM